MALAGVLPARDTPATAMGSPARNAATDWGAVAMGRAVSSGSLTGWRISRAGRESPRLFAQSRLDPQGVRRCAPNQWRVVSAAPLSRARGGRRNRDREKPHGSPLPHHRAYGSRTRRFGRLSQTWNSTLADSQFQPERALSSNQPRFHPSHQARARWTRRMPYRGSRTSHCSSLSIPSRGTVRAFGLRRCGSAYRLLRLSAWSASLALPAFLLLCPLLTSPRYSAPVTRRPASIR